MSNSKGLNLDLYAILTNGDKFVEKCKTKGEKGVGLLAAVNHEKANIYGK